MAKLSYVKNKKRISVFERLSVALELQRLHVFNEECLKKNEKLQKQTNTLREILLLVDLENKTLREVIEVFEKNTELTREYCLESFLEKQILN